jgi:hypothetical protein
MRKLQNQTIQFLPCLGVHHRYLRDQKLRGGRRIRGKIRKKVVIEDLLDEIAVVTLTRVK